MRQREDAEDPTSSLRKEAEDKFARIPWRSRGQVGKTPDEIIQELQVHQIELEIQNEELKQTYLDLEDARDKFIDLYDLAPVGYFSLTDKALIAEVNLTGAEMLGVVRQKQIHKPFRRFISLKDHDQWDRFFIAVLKQGERQTCEVQIKRQDGNEFSARIEGIRVEKSDGSVQVRLTISDVTDRKRAEEKLKATNQYNRGLIEASIDPFVTISPDGKITDVNNATEEITGRSREDLIRTDFADYFTEPQKARAGYFSVLEMGLVRDLSLEIRHQNGHITPVLYNASLYFDEGGNVAGIFAMARDITKRKKMEEALRESEEQYQATFDAVDDFIHVVDRDLRILLFNEAFGRSFSKQGMMDNLQGKDLFDLLPFLSEKVHSEYQTVLKTGTELITEEATQFEGSLRWTDTRKIPIKDQDGKTYRVVTIIRDITERKKMIDQIEVSLHEKETLLKEIHHRVKNNLQVIASIINLQIRRHDDPIILNILQDSQDRIKTMALVHQHLYQGEDIHQINLGNYIRSLGAMLFQSCKKEEQRIRFELESNCISVDINTAIPLGLIINELITNSLKYAFPGTCEGIISIKVTENPQTLTIVVTDNGVGIGDVNPDTRSSLGLRLVNLLTEQLYGQVMVDQLNGTSFTFVIPKITPLIS